MAIIQVSSNVVGLFLCSEKQHVTGTRVVVNSILTYYLKTHYVF